MATAAASRADLPAPLSALDYQQLINRLFPRLTGGIRWGLDRTQELLRKADNPERRYSTIHVAGTNGKGSVAATIASILQHAGHRTGLYSSPHLCSFRERIRVNGEPISERELLSTAEALWPDIEASGASFFEATTVLAFQTMANASVEVAVIEVGLGGRLDSTNVIAPQLSLITNIAFDHADYLGHTIKEIAAEKAGIIKAGVPLVTAENNPEVLDLFRARCAALDSPLHIIPPDLDAQVSAQGSRINWDSNSWGRLELVTPLIGEHQARNTALAVGALDLQADQYGIKRDEVLRGVANVRWPGRFQVERNDRTWIFDVAHNEAGVQSLAQTFRSLPWPQPIVLLVGILGDKEWARMLPPLFSLADHIVLTVPPTAPTNRAWDPQHVLHTVKVEHAEVQEDFLRALQRVRALSSPAGTVLVAGSFHTVGDALGVLGWCATEPDFPLPHNGFHG